MPDTTLTRRIEAEKRQLMSMAQHQQALARGHLTEADIDRMAIERVRSGRTSGRRRTGAVLPQQQEPRLGFLGSLYRAEDAPLMEGPWWIGAYAQGEPGLEDSASLPLREYLVYSLHWNGKRYVCISLDWEAA